MQERRQRAAMEWQSCAEAPRVFKMSALKAHFKSINYCYFPSHSSKMDMLEGRSSLNIAVNLLSNHFSHLTCREYECSTEPSHSSFRIFRQQYMQSISFLPNSRGKYIAQNDTGNLQLTRSSEIAQLKGHGTASSFPG